MLTLETIDNLMSVDMKTVDVQKLTDISTLELDNSLPKEKRMGSMLQFRTVS